MNLNDEVATVAYELFERDGRQHGKDQEHWHEAERIVRERRAKKRASKQVSPQKEPPAAVKKSAKAVTAEGAKAVESKTTKSK